VTKFAVVVVAPAVKLQGRPLNSARILIASRDAAPQLLGLISARRTRATNTDLALWVSVSNLAFRITSPAPEGKVGFDSTGVV
jgi:hypothetical protein